MKDDGIEKFYQAFGVDVSTEMVFWLVSMQMEAKTYGEYSYEEFLKGCQVNSSDTIEKWKKAAPKLRDQLKNDDLYK